MVSEREGMAPGGRRRTVLVVLLVPLAVLVLMIGAAGAWVVVYGVFENGCDLSEAQTVAWAGFVVDDDVEVSAVRSACALDQDVSFTIRGHPAAVDDVVERSGFEGEFAPGLGYPLQASLFDESAVADLRSVASAVEERYHAGDGWDSRQVVRGELGGEVVLLVAAYGD